MEEGSDKDEDDDDDSSSSIDLKHAQHIPFHDYRGLKHLVRK